jgi:hypothetical protein
MPYSQHPFPLKFCDQQCAVRTQAHNLSNSRKFQTTPPEKKMPLKKGTFVPGKKKFQTRNPLRFPVLYHTPVSKASILEAQARLCKSIPKGLRRMPGESAEISDENTPPGTRAP